MAPLPVLQRLTPAFAAVLSLACFGWCWFVDFQSGAAELARVIGGLAALWAPLGLLVFLSLRDRVTDGLTHFTLSAAATYTLTTPLYALVSLADLRAPNSGKLFYGIQALLLVGGLVWLVRDRRTFAIAAPLAPTGEAGFATKFFGQIDWILTLLIALSVLVTPRYKESIQSLPDGSRRLITHGDVTYLAAQAYELDRGTPALQQSVRAGVKERAYHNYPHLTTMLVARFTGQGDMLRALMHYEFTLVDVLVCLSCFLIARGLTGSRWAGYLAVAALYVLAIPLPPLVENNLGCFYFTWHPHATSNLEGAIISSPQTYCALPVIFGVLLVALQFSQRLSRGLSLGVLAILLALMTAALFRFRVQTFLLLFPAVMLLLAWVGWRTRQRSLLAAGALGLLLVAAQAAEMRLPIYYEDTCRLTLHTTGIMHTHTFLNAWPGAGPIRQWLEAHCGPKLFLHSWQVLCATLFTLLNVVGAPVAVAAIAHVVRPANWRSETWIYTALVLWLSVGSIIGATCVGTTYDMYSVGGQMMLLVGWYLLPLLSVGLWRAAERLHVLSEKRMPRIARPLPAFGAALAIALLLSACVWQRTRPPSELEQKLITNGTKFSAAEWQALETMRQGLPAEAVVLSKVDHHDPFACVFSGIVGRRAYLEYLIDSHFAGGPREDNVARTARIDALWNAAGSDDFAQALAATGATHVVEYARRPLAAHPSESLDLWWASAGDEVRIWQARPRSVRGDKTRDFDKLFAADHR